MTMATKFLDGGNRAVRFVNGGTRDAPGNDGADAFQVCDSLSSAAFGFASRQVVRIMSRPTLPA
jgi:hypothetical protein